MFKSWLQFKCKWASLLCWCSGSCFIGINYVNCFIPTWKFFYLIFQVLKEEFPKGIDIIYESVGGDMLNLCLNALAVHGRLIVIGMISQVFLFFFSCYIFPPQHLWKFHCIYNILCYPFFLRGSTNSFSDCKFM